jgi:hypothetical protein
MMFAFRLFVIFLLTCPMISFGAQSKIPTKRIMTVVKTYANTVGCFIHMEQNNIVEHKINGRRVYVALYSIDDGCTTGNNMFRPAFAALQGDGHGGVLVIPEYSIPSATSEKFSQHINKIFIRNNELWYSGMDYNWGHTKPGEEGDALCCPSMPVEGKILFQNGTWIDSTNQ